MRCWKRCCPSSRRRNGEALQALEEIRAKKEAALNALSVLRALPAVGLVQPAVAAQELPVEAQAQDTTEQQPVAPAQAPAARKAARKPAVKKAAPAGEKAGSAKASARKATKGVRVPASRKPAAGQQQPPAAAKRGRLSAEGVLAALGEFTEPVPAKDVAAKLGLDGTAANVNNVRALLGQLARTSRATNPKRGMYAVLGS
ncbi:hypothetical protein F7Q99_27955 [Streptomyces kaniharaensis]|uniref:Uncharacterized protein n=1 Tax=Streptomyces kaniharaensis TaxID=212423 RepID=A0A6N7KWF5_9ACTN|nr:hypothetical protein [Streptomyces kaniharaensis]MQS15982.1 hypothetical protein [Streptomyces kaniharaensis]